MSLWVAGWWAILSGLQNGPQNDELDVLYRTVGLVVQDLPIHRVALQFGDQYGEHDGDRVEEDVDYDGGLEEHVPPETRKRSVRMD